MLYLNLICERLIGEMHNNDAGHYHLTLFIIIFYFYFNHLFVLIFHSEGLVSRIHLFIHHLPTTSWPLNTDVFEGHILLVESFYLVILTIRFITHAWDVSIKLKVLTYSQLYLYIWLNSQCYFVGRVVIQVDPEWSILNQSMLYYSANIAVYISYNICSNYYHPIPRGFTWHFVHLLYKIYYLLKLTEINISSAIVETLWLAGHVSTS